MEGRKEEQDGRGSGEGRRTEECEEQGSRG